METNGMAITITGIRPAPRERLRERLDQASLLRCPVHGETVHAVMIHGRENGWFDARWTTCCEALERQATAILKDRCQ